MTCQNGVRFCILSLILVDFHVSGTKIIIIKVFHLPSINEYSTLNNAHILGKCLQCPSNIEIVTLYLEAANPQPS